MTERLWQLRHDGAEQLGNALTAVFSPMVAMVCAQQGIIPLFAGDAFAAIFPVGEDGSGITRAWETAFFIQQTIQQNPVIATQDQTYHINIKLGMAGGQVEWRIVGESDTCTFYFRGEAIDRAGQAQGLANEGEIVAAAGTPGMTTMCVETAVIAGTPFQRVQVCQQVLNYPLPMAQTTQFNPQPFIPAAVHQWSGTAEFREAAPVFISFQPPDDPDILDHFIREALTLAPSFGGVFSQVDFGDKGGLLVIWFGAPQAHENSPRRAAEYLLALRQREHGVKWRAGITYGVVWAGLRGGEQRCEYGLVGDVVNLSARLALAAEWGDIWVDTAVYQRLKLSYWLASLGERRLRGKAEETAVYQLLQRRTPEDGPAVSPTHSLLIGRNAELNQLLTFTSPIFDGCFAGVGTVHGDAGMGKTSLIRAFQAQLLRTAFPNWFTCPSDEITAVSLHPFRTFLRRYFRQLPDISRAENQTQFDMVFDFLTEEITAHLPGMDEILPELKRTRSVLAALVDLHDSDSFYAQLDPQLRHDNIFTAVISLIKALSLWRPVVMHFEDAHWMDADSRHLLAQMATALSGYPVAILITARFRDNGRPHSFVPDNYQPVMDLALPALPATAVRLIAQQALQVRISGVLASFLAERTGGNPMFVEELAMDLQDKRILVEDSQAEYTLVDQVPTELPPTINAVLTARLDRLPLPMKQMVQQAAALGVTFERGVLAAMLSNGGMTGEQMETAVDQHIWVPLDNDRYQFRHALLREAAYNMLLPTQRKHVHNLAAKAIETQHTNDLRHYCNDLAYHHECAGNLEAARTWYAQAGAEAASLYANDEAIRSYTRALRLVAPGDAVTRWQLLLQREMLYDMLGNREAQLADLTALNELASASVDGTWLVDVRLRQAKLARVTGDFQQAVIMSLQAQASARQIEDLPREAAATISLGTHYQYQAAFTEAETELRAGLEMGQRLGSMDLVAKCVGTLGAVFWATNRLDLAERYVRWALRLHQERGDVQHQGLAVNRLGLVSENQHRYEAGRNYFLEALRIFQSIGDRWNQSIVLGNLGYLYMRLGLFDLSLAYYEADLDLARATADHRGEAWTLTYLSYLASQQGDWETAVSRSLASRTLIADLSNHWLDMISNWHLGRALFGVGKLDDAESVLQQALAVAREKNNTEFELEILGTLAEVALARGDLSRAQSLIVPVVAYLDQTVLNRAGDAIRVYLTCYEVLAAAQDDHADVVLRQSCALLGSRAQTISDRAIRHAYLQGVRSHRGVLAAANRSGDRQMPCLVETAVTPAY